MQIQKKSRNNNSRPPAPSHPADGEDEARLAGADAHEAEAQLPVEPVLADEGDERQSHGGTEHVEDSGHVIYIQLAGHHLVLLVVADPGKPQGLEFLHLSWTEKRVIPVRKVSGRNCERMTGEADGVMREGSGERWMRGLDGGNKAQDVA